MNGGTPTSVTPGIAPPDLMSALGGNPAASLAQLIQSIQQMSQAPLYSNTMQQLGGALGGAAAAYRGQPDPAALLMEQRNQQLQRLLNLGGLQLQFQELQDKAQERREKRTDALRVVYGDMSKLSDFPEIQDIGIRGTLGLLSQRGIQLPSIGSGFLTRRLKKEDLPRIGQLIVQGAPLPTIQRLFPGFTQDDYNEFLTKKDDPAFRKMADLPPKSQEDKDRLDLEIAEQDALVKKFGLDDDMGRAVRQLSLAEYQKPFSALTTTQQKTLIDKLDIRPGKPKLGEEHALRGQYLGLSKEFDEVRGAYGRIMAAGQNPSPAGDLALLVGYMKLIDPKTGVREGELATAQSAGSIPEHIRALYNRLVTGTGFITHNQRQDFLTQAYHLFESHRAVQLGIEQQYKTLATRKRMAPEDVVPDVLLHFRAATAPARRIKFRVKNDPTRWGYIKLKPGQALPPHLEAID